jgi:hypothetical protein
MPVVIIFLILAPNILLLLVNVIFVTGLKLFTISFSVQGESYSLIPDTQLFYAGTFIPCNDCDVLSLAGVNLWGLMMLSPHGCLFVSLLDVTSRLGEYIKQYPPVGASLAFMIVETVLFLGKKRANEFLLLVKALANHLFHELMMKFVGTSFYIDSRAVISILPQTDPTFDPSVLELLDPDVKAERDATMNTNRDLVSPLHSESRSLLIRDTHHWPLPTVCR